MVVKKTWPTMFILTVGAVINVILNYLLIPVIGIEGAAIATLLGYVITDIVLVIVLLRMNLIVMSKRFVFVSFMMIVYFVFWRMFVSSNVFWGTTIAVLFLLMNSFLYKQELGMVVELIGQNRK